MVPPDGMVMGHCAAEAGNRFVCGQLDVTPPPEHGRHVTAPATQAVKSEIGGQTIRIYVGEATTQPALGPGDFMHGFVKALFHVAVKIIEQQSDIDSSLVDKVISQYQLINDEFNYGQLLVNLYDNHPTEQVENALVKLAQTTHYQCRVGRKTPFPSAQTRRCER